MRVLLDTNVLIAAFIARGTCSELLEYGVRNHARILSTSLLLEFEGKLTSKFGFTHKVAQDAVALLRGRMIVVEAASLDQPVCRDPDDDVVLATAVAGECDYIVTGDKDLLVLERFRQIPILAPTDFWRHESS